ncbi:carbon-nitrogen hydrolase, putative [Babesia ovata]|uniref:Carbon-nitrogen hydrolase, putative n=1 Tax=Babesia ovata TaxID=189622 RepID=A0A2H6K6C5_9APIC|nr:carbon-nitrogen hydrolase, putative [Babesia ovata]GBE58538.1 carbon-nitrogen hydrolase, putative [Babesia ovata]
MSFTIFWYATVNSSSECKTNATTPSSFSFCFPGDEFHWADELDCGVVLLVGDGVALSAAKRPNVLADVASLPPIPLSIFVSLLTFGELLISMSSRVIWPGMLFRLGAWVFAPSFWRTTPLNTDEMVDVFGVAFPLTLGKALELFLGDRLATGNCCLLAATAASKTR